jgi:membrane dipeptidase
MLNPFGLGQEQRKRWLNAPETFAGADLERYRSSGIQVFHIAIGTGGPEAFVESLKHIGSWNGFVANHDQYLLRIDSPGDLDRVKGSGKLGILLGLQNSEHFGTLEDVNLFHGMGQRVSQLTYNARNLTVAVRPKGGTMG